MKTQKKISIVTPCYNERDNLRELYRRVRLAIGDLDYSFEILFIDNASNDGSQEVLREIALSDSQVRVILNTRNFGHIRSPYYGILQSTGDATIYLASDLQDPPELIPEFIEGWEEGYKLVMAVKPNSEGSRFMHRLRKMYYKLLDRVSDIEVLYDSTGFGLYDRVVLDHIREINDPYPFLRGLVSELGFEIKRLIFNQPKRTQGLTKNNLFTLYDIGILGLISHSKAPLRLASFIGFVVGILSFCAAIFFVILKLFFWEKFPMGIAPIVISMFFLFGMLFSFIGILGEYIASIHTYVKKRPIVVEKERINFK